MRGVDLGVGCRKLPVLYKLAHVAALQVGSLQSPQSTEFYQLQLPQNLPRLLKI